MAEVLAGLAAMPGWASSRNSCGKQKEQKYDALSPLAKPQCSAANVKQLLWTGRGEGRIGVGINNKQNPAGHRMSQMGHRRHMNFQLQVRNGGIDLDRQNFAVELFPALQCHVNLQRAAAGIAELAGQNGNGWW